MKAPSPDESSSADLSSDAASDVHGDDPPTNDRTSTSSNNTSTDTAQVFFVDAHPISRYGYKALLSSENDLAYAGGVSSASEARDALDDTGEEKTPDLVVIDVALDGLSGLDLLEYLMNAYPDVHTLVVSTHKESLFGERVLQAGSRGYVPKEMPCDELLEAIRKVLDGQFYLSKDLERKVLQKYTGRSEGASPLELLSDREMEIFERIGLGQSTREISDDLDISIKTVQTHRGNVKKKLDIDTVEALMRRAVLWTLEQR